MAYIKAHSLQDLLNRQVCGQCPWSALFRGIQQLETCIYKTLCHSGTDHVQSHVRPVPLECPTQGYTRVSHTAYTKACVMQGLFNFKPVCGQSPWSVMFRDTRPHQNWHTYTHTKACVACRGCSTSSPVCGQCPWSATFRATLASSTAPACLQ